MEYTLFRRGVPIAVLETPELASARATLARPLPGCAELRALLPPWPRGADRPDRGAPATELTESLELRDALGRTVAATRIELWTADPVYLLARVHLDTDPAAVGAWRLPPAGGGSAEADG